MSEQQQYQTVPSNSPATAAMVLGIIGVVFGMIPLFGLIAFPMAVLAIIFGWVGLRKLGRGETPKGKGAAMTGIITGVLAFILAIVGMNIVSDGLDDISNELDELERELDDFDDEFGS